MSIHDHTRDTYCIHLFTCTIAHCTWLMGTGYWVLYTREHDIDVYNAVRQCGLWSRDPWDLDVEGTPIRIPRPWTLWSAVDAARGGHMHGHTHTRTETGTGGVGMAMGPNEETQALVAGAIPHSEAVQAPGKERGFIQLSCTSEGSQVLDNGQDTRSTEKDHRTSISSFKAVSLLYMYCIGVRISRDA